MIKGIIYFTLQTLLAFFISINYKEHYDYMVISYFVGGLMFGIWDTFIKGN